MSYQRTSSSSGDQSNQSQGDVPQQHQSPLDWNNYTYLANTPPAAPSGPANGNGNNNSNNGYNQNQEGFQQPYNQRPQDSNYSSGATRPSPHYGRSNSNLQVPQAQGLSSAAKGKAPVHRPDLNARVSNPAIDPANPDNGLSLDPAAFTRDIRFQVPSFLSNQAGGAQTFPPGGEAWSGFSFPDAQNGSGPNLTPGSMFNNLFGLGGGTPDGQNYATGDGNDGRNVLQGLSGFMDGDNSWSDWNMDVKGDSVSQPVAPTAAFYVNPNPTPSVISQRIPSNQNQQQRQNLSANSKAGVRPGESPRNTFQAPSPLQNSTMPTSAILPPSTAYNNSLQRNDGLPYVPSVSAPTSMTNNINIASSSTAPYAPPSNTDQLLSGPSLPSSFGPSLSDGPGLYSTTGFDMVGVLTRVGNRKDPKTVLGPIDLSCSFVVVDVRRYDSPIVYASPTFLGLTGYDLPSLLGRNCRFLQAPDGEVVKGSKRKYTDNVAVAHLKRMLNAGKECQASLINYRRGGVPFINLVTVVPIPWEGTDIVYHVGFQVDLVEQPNAILRNMRDGSYQVNYTVTNPPQPPMRPAAGRDLTHGLNADILEVMGNRINQPGFGSGEEGGKTDWLKMVLEHADDFIHVLSLKGLFQYVSPSVRRVLEYEPEDLLNKNIADICHPSDIVPLMRELKDSTHVSADGQPSRNVNLVFRIRRKHSGYVWIECAGRLHVEPGKGRKAVILSGRARSVPTLPWDSISKHGGLAENEVWVKMSYQGLILHVTDAANSLLGLGADDLLGQSLYSFLPGGDNGPPSQAHVTTDPNSAFSKLSKALSAVVGTEIRSGGITVPHRMVTKSGKTIEVETTVYTPVSSSSISRDSSEEDSPSIDSESSQSQSAAAGVAGVQPNTLVAQIKLRTAIPKATRPIVHSASANVFEELETTRGTSWQYELHQLRLLNRRLKEDIQSSRSALAKSGGKGKNKKRRAEEAMAGGSNAGGMAPPPIPDQMTVAPRHQMAPGFGLVAPGTSSPFY